VEEPASKGKPRKMLAPAFMLLMYSQVAFSICAGVGVLLLGAAAGIVSITLSLLCLVTWPGVEALLCLVT